MKKLALLITTQIVVLCTHLLQAQVTTSEIRGRVYAEGTTLSGATISAVHTPSGTRYNVSSRADGYYTIANARIGGPYTRVNAFKLY